MGAKAGSITGEPAHLIDLLPTLAEITGAEIPTEFPGRTPTPLAGVSITPILAGKKIGSRPPIHLLFARDRGLRDGDWKLVSLRTQPWELYNIREDRTKLHNLASEQPERVAKMVKTRQELAINLLHAPPSDTKPVGTGDENRSHPEWSDYSGKRGAITSPAQLKAPLRGRKADE